ncbi:MAG: amidohydrolase [Clostridia bacterium]|nr:amidohydrolase [Clostridia bacterium]
MGKLSKLVTKHEQLIRDAHAYFWANPETGYKEFKTSKYMEDKFIELGYDIVRAENITGFYTTIDTGRAGPTLLILGELDSIICPSHPDADKTTGAVHSCGHSAQCSALLGVAAALKEPHALDELSGKIKLCAVPAEELLEIEFRSDLIKKGIIKYYGGKTEFISRGYFDDVDLAFMVHTINDKTYRARQGAVGIIAKKVKFTGKAAHAGGQPWDGKNALYAANTALTACNALRETFKERDIIRFHPIITSGGSMVNAIPETVTMESYVRGKTFDAIIAANNRLNQAIVGSSLALDCNVDIDDKAGYAPLVNSADMLKVAEEAHAISDLKLPYEYFDEYWSASTDMGDVACIMPAVHPYAPGAIGTGHGNDYYIIDVDNACIGSAKWQLSMIEILLSNGATRAKEIVKNFKPMFTKEEFLTFYDSLSRSGNRITYADGEAKVNL